MSRSEAPESTLTTPAVSRSNAMPARDRAIGFGAFPEMSLPTGLEPWRVESAPGVMKTFRRNDSRLRKAVTSIVPRRLGRDSHQWAQQARFIFQAGRLILHCG